MSKKVYIFLADGFEDIEGLTVVDLMRRAQIDIKTVSIKDIRDITTSHGIHMQTDLVFKETDFSDADMLVIPGGMPGTKYLGEYQPLCDLLTDFYKQGKKVAAICAAPTVFAALGFLEGRKATCLLYTSFGIHLSPMDYVTVIGTATLASVGTAGVPSVGLVTLTMVFNSVGLPVEAIGLIMGIDRILDMTRTAVNITGDAVCTTIVAHQNGALDKKVFNETA